MRESMRATVVLLAVGLSACSLIADEIEAKIGSSYMTYSSVRITSFIDGKVGYTTANGQKPVISTRTAVRYVAKDFNIDDADLEVEAFRLRQEIAALKGGDA